MMELAKELFPINRSITGQGVRDTLAIIRKHIPITFYCISSGMPAFDWVVPPEWNLYDAWLKDPLGNIVADAKLNNLHVVGYSEPMDCDVGWPELQEHLHSLPDKPTAIPYVTSYYDRNWGFCVSHRARQNFIEGTYRVCIKSTLEPGHLNYGEWIIPGQTDEEIFISTYICHPSMANDQVSGMVVATELAKWVGLAPRRYTYRFVFAPETIGSIIYLSRNLKNLKRNVVAAFNVCFVGDDGELSMIRSRHGETLADRVAEHVLGHLVGVFRDDEFIAARGSDERQYCSPGLDLPMVVISRSLGENYPQYHTSLDDLSIISEANLEGSYNAIRRMLEVLEMNRTYKCKFLCEPQMGKRGLYGPPTDRTMRTRMDILQCCDGKHDVIAMADKIGMPAWELAPFIEQLEVDLIEAT